MKTKIVLAYLLIVLPSLAWSYDTVHFLPSFSVSEAKKPIAVRAALGRYYVLDEKGRLLVYDKSGKLTDLSSGKTARLRYPEGLAVASDKVYVADTGNSVLRAYNRDGKFLFSMGVPGSRAGQFDDPSSIAIGADGRIYVADTGNRKIEVFTPDGLFLFWFGEKGSLPGQWSRPDKIAVDASDRIYVLDRSNERIEEFDSSAHFLVAIPFNGQDFAVDRYGFIYGISAARGRITEWGPDGAELGHFGSRGSGAGQFKWLRSIDIAQNGNLVILDGGKKTVDLVSVANKFKVHPIHPNANTKLFPSGPDSVWNYAANPILLAQPNTYIYLTQEGKFNVLDSSGNILFQFGKKGKKEDQTWEATGLALDPSLGFYVSDAPRHRIEHFVSDSSGAWKWDKNIAEPSGWFDGLSKEGRVRNPQGLAVNGAGTLYIADPGNHRVDAYTPDGVFLFSIGPKLGSFELEKPVSVAWDKAGFVYFLDRELKKVFKCNPSGELISSWGEMGEAPGKFEDPIALAFDGENYIYVLDHTLKRVSAFSTNGRWIMDFFSGSLIGNPVSLSVDKQVLRISDRLQKHILSFHIHPSLSAPLSISTAAKEGTIDLSWEPVKNSWTKDYLIYRSDKRYENFMQIGTTDQNHFTDSSAQSGQVYYYRLATEAKTGDIGAQSRAIKAINGESANRPRISISSVTLSGIFPANYKWYLKNPIGSATITNNSDVPFNDLKLTFQIKNYMDFGYDLRIKKLDSMASIAVPLIATLNNTILNVTEETPIQAKLTLTYFEKNKKKTISLAQPLTVYSRNAITWQDPRRIANFITPNDTPVFDFERAVLHHQENFPAASALNSNVLAAMRLWEALGVYGMQYAENPSNSFEKISTNPNFPIDYAQFPRETLRRKSGQCDDLTTLFISMLDADNIHAAIIDYPGHMAFMFDTHASSWTDAALPKDSLISYEGTYWVPVESTLIGKSFLDAVRNAAYSYNTELKKGEVHIIDVRKAWETYEPVTMPPTNWKAETPNMETVNKFVKENSENLFHAAYRSIQKRLKEKIASNPSLIDPRLALGVWEYEDGNIHAAKKSFKSALAISSTSAAAYNDLGNIAFLKRKYHEAERWYNKAARNDPGNPDIWMNFLKTEIHLKNARKVSESAKQIQELDPSYGPAVDILVKNFQEGNP